MLTDVMRHLFDAVEPTVIEESVHQSLREMELNPNPSTGRLLIGYASWYLYRDAPMPGGLRPYIARILRQSYDDPDNCASAMGLRRAKKGRGLLPERTAYTRIILMESLMVALSLNEHQASLAVGSALHCDDSGLRKLRSKHPDYVENLHRIAEKLHEQGTLGLVLSPPLFEISFSDLVKKWRELRPNA
ncbi:hypothetical protein [Thiorhodococcus minor]|uniref:Uncharacterized protein n=1 Tax=Thiorhodococcus minor TaxID=57489 RepID=A0A6M0JWU3_9GAMM|nr:hypothetical protein [Thiorhodococcus minor]NEV61649.1 hypothetical protein [Thiorhodococcus minor]